MARHTGSVTHMTASQDLHQRLQQKKKKMGEHININWHKHTISNVCADAAALPASKADASWKEPHHALPWYICWRGEKVGAVYYWTRWRIDRPGSGPVFGGLAVLLSALSFPQHQSRWLQLLTDQSRDRLVSRRKEGLRPQTPHTGRLGFPYRAEWIDCRDAVVSDYRGRGGRRLGKKLNPVTAQWRLKPEM